MPYAILRTAKLTSLGSVGGSAQHNFRERDTPNADPEMTLEGSIVNVILSLYGTGSEPLWLQT